MTNTTLYQAAVAAYSNPANDETVMAFVKACEETNSKTSAVQSALGMRIAKNGKISFAKEEVFERTLRFLKEEFNAEKKPKTAGFFFKSGEKAFFERKASAKVMKNCHDLLTNEPTGRTAEEIQEAAQDRYAAQKIFDNKWVRFNRFNDTLFDINGQDNNQYELWLSKTQTKDGNFLAWVKYHELKNNPFWQYNRRVKGHYDHVHRMMCVVVTPEQNKLIINSFKKAINNQQKQS